MTILRRFRSKEVEKSARAETTSCSHDAAINVLAADIRALTARNDGLQRAFGALNAFRIALETKTWIAFHQRRSGHVAVGRARASTVRHDARGRYLSDVRSDQ
jgi:hypothetical protein